MLGLSAVQFDEQAASALVPTQILDSIYSGRMWTGSIFSVLPAPVASTFLFTNNISVALLAFAGGLSFGVVSFWILFFNGVMLGMVFKLCANYGLLGPAAGVRRHARVPRDQRHHRRGRRGICCRRCAAAAG